MSQLRDALTVAQEFWQEYSGGDKQQQHWLLFEALTRQTVADIDEDQNCEDAQKYETDYLALCISKVKEPSSSTSVSAKRIKQLFDKLTDILDEHRCRLEEISRDRGFSVIPLVKRQQGGGANIKSMYWIEAVAIQAEVVSRASAAGYSPRLRDQDSDIQYYLEALPKLPIWSRCLIDISFGRRAWSRWLMVILAASPFLSLVAFGVSSLLIAAGVTFPNPSVWMSVFLIYPMAYLSCIGFLGRALNNSIALLPTWMLPLRLNSAVLELDINGSSNRNYRVMAMTIKVYAAKCPVCRHRIDLRDGGIMNWGRIIGVCDYNPAEHRYSFDFTTLTGKALR